MRPRKPSGERALPTVLGILALGAVAAVIAACHGGDGPGPAVPPAPPGRVVAGADGGIAGSDPLGPRPELGEPAPYAPPVPVTYKRPNGMAVWLVERHGLPIVSIDVVVPAGAAQDPEGKGGLAVITASMLDEGAGKRGALDIARDVDRLGATIVTGAYADYGYAQLTVLKKNLPAAAAIFGDIVGKPQLPASEWKRVYDLWENGLRARQSDPEAVASVVVTRKAFPANHPYAHPSEGVLASAAKVTLEDVKKFYGARWRPERATCVVVGDITRPELDALLDQALAGWASPKGAAASADAPASAQLTGKDEPPPTQRRVVVVDRPDAPQSVIAVARSGVSAFDEDSAGLVRVSSALGGSFTSRLNQDLREEHGWTYGAKTRFSFNRLRGVFVAQAAVQTEHTGEALKAMLTDIEVMAKGGLTDEELEKTKKLARADLVEAFETVQGAAARLGRNAGVGQAANHETVSSQLVARADKAKLKRLAADHLDLTGAVIVIVGPRAKLDPQLKAIGINAVESSGPEGQ